MNKSESYELKRKRVLDEEDGSIGELEEDEQHDEKEVVYAGTG